MCKNAGFHICCDVFDVSSQVFEELAYLPFSCLCNISSWKIADPHNLTLPQALGGTNIKNNNFALLFKTNLLKHNMETLSNAPVTQTDWLSKGFLSDRSCHH